MAKLLKNRFTNIIKEKSYLKLVSLILNISPITVGIILYMKSTLLNTLITYGSIKKQSFYSLIVSYFNMYFIYHIAIVLFIVNIGYALKSKYRTIYLISIDTFISIIFLADISYYRGYSILLSLKMLFNPSLFNPLNKPLFNFRFVDLAFIIDIVIFCIIIFLNSKMHILKNTVCSKRKIAAFIIILIFTVSTVIKYNFFLNQVDLRKKSNNIFYQDYIYTSMSDRMGPIGYHMYDAFLSSKDKRFEWKMQNKGMEDITQWINDNKEDIPDNEYKGVFKGKNLIFIQIESLDGFLINNKINGQEITPNINKLLKNSIYFDNIYAQNSTGMSSDCDFMVNTSVLPIIGEMTAMEYPDTKYNTISSLLKQKGYNSLSSIGEIGPNLGGFKWQEVHKVCFQFDNVLDYTSLDQNEMSGMGLSDKAYLKGIESQIENLKTPFFDYSITLSTHSPYDAIQKSERMLDLPKDLDSTILGNYFQSFRYTDQQVGDFISYVENTLNLNNTVFVIYGDHDSLHFYNHDKVQNIKTEENWWKDTTKKIPFIIYSPGQKGEVIHKYGGQIDFLPTIAYMMGIDRKDFDSTAMGKVLVNTNMNSTIYNDRILSQPPNYKNYKLVGQPSTENEKQHMLQAPGIADKYTRGNYVKWKNSKGN